MENKNEGENIYNVFYCIGAVLFGIIGIIVYLKFFS